MRVNKIFTLVGKNSTKTVCFCEVFAFYFRFFVLFCFVFLFFSFFFFVVGLIFFPVLSLSLANGRRVFPELAFL